MRTEIYFEAQIPDGRIIWVDPAKVNVDGQFVGHDCYAYGKVGFFYIGAYMPGELNYTGRKTTVFFRKLNEIT